jgi:8-oxo-dGTP diphosphatase
MILTIIRTLFTFLLLAVLVLNMTQRKHLSHGEGKRFATLKIAGVLFIVYAGFWVMERTNLPDLLAVPVVLIAAIVAFVFRRELFPFRTRCVACGTRLPLSRIVYFDSNRCRECDPEELELDDTEDNDSQESDTDPNRDIPSPAEMPAAPVPHLVTEIDWEHHRFDQEAVLCFARRGEEVLLIHKKTGLGTGKVNAPGGRLEPGETPAEAAIRETQEETGVTPLHLEERADLSFLFTNGFSLHVKAFFAGDMEGEPHATREADPFFCPIQEIPYEKMWADDREWLPRSLQGDYVMGRFIFEGDTMLDMQLETHPLRTE